MQLWWNYWLKEQGKQAGIPAWHPLVGRNGRNRTREAFTYWLPREHPSGEILVADVIRSILQPIPRIVQVPCAQQESYVSELS